MSVGLTMATIISIIWLGDKVAKEGGQGMSIETTLHHRACINVILINTLRNLFLIVWRLKWKRPA